VDSDGGELRLWPASPCIDTGDPEQDPDPDGTRADMGAIPFSQSSFVVGRVTSSLDDSPVLGAVVVTSYGDSTMSYYRGEYILNRAMYDFGFSMKASASGYADQDVVGIWLTKNDTLTQNFALPQPLLTPSQDFVVRDLEPGGDWSDVFTLTNAGNWDVDWQVERRVAEADLPVWSLYGSHSIGFWLQDTRLQGVAYGNDHFYVAGGGRDTCYIYVYDHEMNLVAQYPQCGDAAIGFRDLEWDGALLWGAGARTVYGFTPEGEVIQSWRGPYSANQALAWDTDRDLLWIAALPGDDIYGYDSYGNPVTSIPQNGLRIFGLAYYPLDPDGYCLYAMDSPDLNSQVIHKINPENGDTMFVARLEPPGGGLPAGLYISDEYVQFAWTLMAIANNGFRDRVDIWYLGSDPSWLSLTPTSGRISSFTRKDLALDLSAAELDTGIYEAILHFELTNVHSVLSVPVTLQVAVNAAPEPGDLQPLRFGLNQIYPNPFNGKAVIRYGLAKSGDVNLSVYDLSGRLVRTLQEGEAAPGRYSLTWNAAGLPSGVYVVKLEAGGNQFYAKAALIR